MTFDELPLPAPLAAALAARGYETPTGVQAAVLDPAVAGRDLLVSSQTGSGKTVAFGAALAQTLLAAPAPAAAPAALVIVPTRELATQVRGELGWLLAGTGLRLASFTGGTPVGGDLRALERGLDVVIGTPGRLVDLLRRQRLPLGALRVVVLDEADEMLDLGFREDLETILEAAPVERRTLLLSATLPPEIRAMARRFQRDAVPIDPRRAEGGPTRAEAHEDITYVAHLVAPADRLAAVVNVLRASDSPRAIVFCTTREGVAGLHAALIARGFAATAISGERAQAERDRALAQLRRGEVRILVATNVAARGLDLPDVDLIVHADL
ncbi:MAG TPA: DEAD/DEAH box helicase, partial [Polyangia bacterium]|nr:DEAD/DEAH box helicase [Polyangia bacterium]